MAPKIIIESDTGALRDISDGKYLTMREGDFSRIIGRIHGLAELYPKYTDETKNLIVSEIKSEIKFLAKEFGYEWDPSVGFELKITNYESKKE